MSKDKEKCSIHGGNGVPTCQECWDVLKYVLDKHNVYFVGSVKK